MASTRISARVIFGVLLAIVPVFLLSVSVPRLLFGYKIEPLNSLVMATTVGDPIAIEDERAAATAFGEGSREDGYSRALAAEFLALSAQDNQELLLRSGSIVADSLSHDPSNARAWILLCEIEARQSPTRAVACLDTAFHLGAYDWYTAGRRMRLAAFEWPYLDQKLRDQAARLIMPMWNTTQWKDGSTLRFVLYDLSRSDNGRQLLRAGFIADMDSLREFNRFVMQERIWGH